MLRHSNRATIGFPKEFWPILGVAVAIVVALVIYVHSVLEESVASRVVRTACIPPSAATSELCFSQPESLSGEAITALAVSPDQSLLASSSHKTIQLWDLKTGKLQRSLQGHTERISAIAFSPDGQLLASSSLDQTIKLWNFQTGKLVGSLNSGRVTKLAFSPNGQQLAAGSRISRWSDGVVSREGIQLWDIAARQEVDSFAVPRRDNRIGSKTITALAFSPDGELLVAGSTNAQVWELTTGRQLYRLNTGELTDLLFSRDGQTLISGSSRIQLWQLSSGRLLDTIPSSAVDLALSPSGEEMLAIYGGTIHLWQLSTGRLLGKLRGSWYSGLFVEFAQAGQAIVSGSSDGLRIWRGSQRN